MTAFHAPQQQRGFTLIELSVVLVIIGLIVGGVLAGQDLIRAAGVRATITQIEKFNTAANTFYGKYGYLPGDIPAGPAAQFGLAPRGQYAGEGDGNGIVECNRNNTSTSGNDGACQGMGETALFWVDLSAVHLIEGGFVSANATTLSSTLTGSALDSYLPPAKIGGGNYFYVWSGGYIGSGTGPGAIRDGMNYFGISVVTAIDSANGYTQTSLGLTAFQASAIDMKIDDGLPQSGRVTALYVNEPTAGGTPYGAWAGAASGSNGPTTAATVGSATTCYDNSSAASGTPGVNGATQHYSLEISSGSNVTCALSFRMQAGD
jgi:prepilin-type N-terminal cleavage/methylation domain-containing protein